MKNKKTIEDEHSVALNRKCQSELDFLDEMSSARNEFMKVSRELDDLGKSFNHIGNTYMQNELGCLSDRIVKAYAKLDNRYNELGEKNEEN